MGIGEEIHQELFFITAVRRRGVDARQHLHIGAGHVPARCHRCKAVLPLGQVFALGTGLQRKARCAVLAERVDAVGVHTGRAAGGVHNVFAANQHKSLVLALRRDIQAEQTADRAVLAQHFNDLRPVQHRHTLGLHGCFQTFGHLLAGVGADAGSAAAGVMVGLVADVLAIAVARERHTQLDQL